MSFLDTRHKKKSFTLTTALLSVLYCHDGLANNAVETQIVKIIKSKFCDPLDKKLKPKLVSCINYYPAFVKLYENKTWLKEPGQIEKIANKSKMPIYQALSRYRYLINQVDVRQE